MSEEDKNDNRSVLKKNVVNDQYTWIDCSTSWTVVDQRRLNSINNLYNRSLEFHNNHHYFCASHEIDKMVKLRCRNPNEIVLEALLFSDVIMRSV